MNTKRIPRPTGITQLANTYSKTNSIEDKQILLEQIIQSYLKLGYLIK